MKNKIKGLLALVLSVLIGQVWAATPVATWTDFNTLTSGNYTITKGDGCKVNADGSIILQGNGLQLDLNNDAELRTDNVSHLSVVMDVTLPEDVPSNMSLVSFCLNNYYRAEVRAVDSILKSCWWNAGGSGTDSVRNGNYTLTPGRQTITITYKGASNEGTHAYVNGQAQLNDTGMFSSGNPVSYLTIGARYNGVTKEYDLPASGMTVHSLRIYSSKLAAVEVGYISSMMKTKMDANFIASFDGNTTITVGGSATAWASSFGGWDLPSSYVDTLTGKGITLSRDPKVAPYVDSNCSAPFGTGSYTIAIHAQLGQTDGVIWGHGKSLPYASATENYLNLEKQGNKVVLTRGTTTNFNDRQVVCTYDDANVVNDGEYHTFTIVVDNTITDGNITATSLTLYVDGESVTSAETNPLKIVTGGGRTGFQIGNTFGASGGDGATGTIIDEVYGWNRALNASEVSALCALFPIPENVAYVRTIDANADWSATDAWTLDGTSTVAAAPAEGKNAKITATADATLTVNAAADVENFTTAGAGTLTIASDGTNKLTAQKTQIDANTIVNAGAASLGATFIANGKTLTVKDTTTISALSGTGVYNLDLGATTADDYTFAADGKNYKVSSGNFTNAKLNFSTTQTSYEFAGGNITTKIENGVGQFSFGKANVKISGGKISATHLVTSQGAYSCPTTVEQTGGDIVISSTGDGSNTPMTHQAIMFGHYPSASSSYSLSGGSLVAENGGLRFGNDSSSTMTISNTGLLKVKGIKGKGTTTSALTVTGGKLSLGDWGFAAINNFTFTAQGGEINAFGNATINQAIALNGNVTLSADAEKTLTIYTMTGSGSLTVNGEGTVVLPEAVVKAIPVTVAEGATLKVIPTIDTVVAGKLVLAEGSTINGNGTVAIDGVENVTANGATFSFTANAEITGSVWWWDYEFNGSNASIGSDTGTMSLEGSATSYTEADANGNQELYFQKTPYRGAAFASQDAFTAVMYCQPGNYSNVPLIGFGSTTDGDKVTVVLATGANAANGEMQILLIRPNATASAFDVISLADNLIVPNATTAKHLYAFTYEVQADKTVISVYVDGRLKKVTTINEQIHVSNGFQIGSIHGGVAPSNAFNTGLTKYPASGDAGTIDFLRVAKGVFSAETMTALAKAYPYVSEKGIAQRTITDATATWVADASWTQKVPNADDATQAAPNEGTMVELTATAETQVAVNLEADVSYETLTIAGSDVTLVAGDSVKKIVAGDVTIDANVTIPYGVVEVGTLTVNAGKSLTFDFSAYDFASVWADRMISLTGLATVADGAEVTATIPETLPVQIQSATLAYNGETQEYALVIEVVEGELTGTIADDGDWDSITWKKGEVNVTPSDFAAMESVNLTVSADATLTMNKSVTVKNLTISGAGEGALVIAENGGNKLTVSGGTTINANVTATAGAAALGKITIAEGKSLGIKEKIGNVGTIVSNAGELVYMGGNITEDRPLTNAIGEIRIASGTVDFTAANGDYRNGRITIDENATMKTTSQHAVPFGNSPIVNNGAIVVASSGTPRINTIVSGTGSLTLNAGELTLVAENTYEGGTTVNGGTLVISGTDADTKVLPEGKTVTVNTGATIKLVQGLSFVTIEGEGKTLVSGTYTYGISNSFQNTLATKTVEVEGEGVLQFRAWRAYALTIDTLIVNGTLKNEGWDGTTVPTVTVAQGQKLSGTGTIEELAVTLANGALVGNAEVVPETAVVQGSVTCDTAEIATALAEKLTSPTGYHFNVTDKVLSIALNKVTVTIPEAPANTKWYDADGNVVSGSVIVDPNTNVTLTLKADEGYVFADGSTQTTVTVNSGNGAAVTAPNVTAATPVAQVGETKYQTLQDAFAAAKAGDTIILLADVTINSRLDIAQNVTIDLNGQTIDETVEDQFGAIYVKKGATLTIAATNGGEITTDGGIVIGNYGNVVVNGGTIAAGEEPDVDVSIYNFYYQADYYGTTTINGGTVARIWNCGVATLAGGEVTDVDNSGAMEIAEETAVTNIILRDGTDAPGIKGAGTLTAPEGLTVTTMDGQKVVYVDGKYTVVENPAIQLTIDLGDGVSSVDYTIAGNKTTITEDTTIDIAESGTVVSFAVVAADGYFAPTVEAVTVTETTTVTIAGVAFSAVESADKAITSDNRNAVYAWAKSNGKSQSEVSAANYLYADYLFNFTEFSTAEPTIEITEFTADPLVIKAKVTVGGETKIEDLSATGLKLNGTLKYKAAATLEALEAAEPKATLDATDRFFKVVVE